MTHTSIVFFFSFLRVCSEKNNFSAEVTVFLLKKKHFKDACTIEYFLPLQI